MVKYGLMVDPISEKCFNTDECPAIQELKQNIPTAEVTVLQNGSISAVCGRKYYQLAQKRINEICENCKKRQK